MNLTVAFALLIAATAIAADNEADRQLAAKAEVVIHGRRMAFEGADKYAWFRVRILRVIKNESGAELPDELRIAAASSTKGVPEGESTLYLERYHPTNKALWRLIGNGAAAGGATAWPADTSVEVQLKLAATIGPNQQVMMSGAVLIKNPTERPLTIQSPHNRLALAFLVTDSLGNLVAPVGRGKVDPPFHTLDLAPQKSHQHPLTNLEFVSGSACFGYDLRPGKTYKVVAVYRPAGPDGPGFTSPETKLVIPQ